MIKKMIFFALAVILPFSSCDEESGKKDAAKNDAIGMGSGETSPDRTAD